MPPVPCKACQGGTCGRGYDGVAVVLEVATPEEGQDGQDCEMADAGIAAGSAAGVAAAAMPAAAEERLRLNLTPQ